MVSTTRASSSASQQRMTSADALFEPVMDGLQFQGGLVSQVTFDLRQLLVT
ncbi:hypothetical protein [Nocardia vaccinii]|uniref:hypothetical protein n=1 Tax=Nocardia vaccinii TaxID=1822 RepID=UPI001C3F9FE7|nr:hypothetical protein [Nocardia vaccinii]